VFARRTTGAGKGARGGVTSLILRSMGLGALLQFVKSSLSYTSADGVPKTTAVRSTKRTASPCTVAHKLDARLDYSSSIGRPRGARGGVTGGISTRRPLVARATTRLSTRCRSPMRWARAVFPPHPRWVGAGGRARASGRARAMRVGRGGARARARARWRREGRRWRCARSAGGARAGMSARARWATEVGTAPCGPTDQRFVDRGGRSPAFSEIRSPRFLRACSTRDARHGLDWITVATSGRPNGPRGTGCEEQERKILPNVARMFLRVCATRDARHGREREQREGSRLWSSGR